MNSTEDTPVSAAASEEASPKRPRRKGVGKKGNAKRSGNRTAKANANANAKRKGSAAQGAPGKAQRRNKNTQRVHVFGDSHSKFFQPNGLHAVRLGLPKPRPYAIEGKAIPASSVAGFRPGDRKLNVKDTIRAALPEASHLVLAFGQVDLELGYYYRLAVKKETQTPDSYVAWLLNIYSDFLASIDDGNTKIALKGVNLTALTPKQFAAKYVVRIIEGDERKDSAKARKNLMQHLLSEDEQNAMHLAFNAGLAKLAADKGYAYFDLVAETAAPGSSPLRLDDKFMPGDFDHHLVDSLTVRRMHYDAIGKAFGLTPSRKG